MPQDKEETPVTTTMLRDNTAYATACGEEGAPTTRPACHGRGNTTCTSSYRVLLEHIIMLYNVMGVYYMVWVTFTETINTLTRCKTKAKHHVSGSAHFPFYPLS